MARHASTKDESFLKQLAFFGLTSSQTSVVTLGEQRTQLGSIQACREMMPLPLLPFLVTLRR